MVIQITSFREVSLMQRNYWPTIKWLTADPTVLGINLEQLSMLEPMIKSEYSNINGIVIVKDGYIAYERYYNGYCPDDTCHMASATKSIISALIGIAIEEGYIENVERKVLDFFPEYVPGCADEQKRKITIRHLLTMTAPYSFEDWHESLDKMCMQPDWVKYILGMIGQNGNIGTFKYSTAGAHLLSAIITRSTGKSARNLPTITYLNQLA
jgi:CubicO group peptidase (beta-lactamase class C family)